MRLFIIAMEDEFKSLKPLFEKIEDEYFNIYIKDNNLVVISNIGKVNASSSLTYMLNKFPKINEVINIGFTGAYGDFELGDFVLVKDVIYHDFDLSMFGYNKGSVPNVKMPLKSDIKYLRSFYDLKRASLYTGDSFQTKRIKENYIADMEGAAIYHVCNLFNIDVISIKVISDIIGKDDIKDYESFEKNGSKYILNLYNLIENRLK